mmetsp:Transcript_17240/g.35578  ORF Transcript_17240/g.35578 Transcript_17240/m.35578 type:complete len:221 (-) Transcript_17240:633-1295(-)
MHGIGRRHVGPLLLQNVAQGQIQVGHGVLGVRRSGQKGNIRSRVDTDQSIRCRIDDRQGREFVVVHQFQSPCQALLGADLDELLVVGSDLEFVDRVVKEAPRFSKVCDQMLQNVRVGDARQDTHVFWHDNGQEIQAGFGTSVNRVRRIQCGFGRGMCQEEFAGLFEAGRGIGRGKAKGQIHGLRNGRVFDHVRNRSCGKAGNVAVGAFEMPQYIDEIRHL